MNELVVVVIHLTEKFRHTVKVFAIHTFPFFSLGMRGHFGELRVIDIVSKENNIGTNLLEVKMFFYSQPQLFNI